MLLLPYEMDQDICDISVDIMKYTKVICLPDLSQLLTMWFGIHTFANFKIAFSKKYFSWWKPSLTWKRGMTSENMQQEQKECLHLVPVLYTHD